ncbi:glycosyl hydrolase-related protein, partial [Dolichospermum sp. ST_sed9]|nr:glycosyl hydrolase-related protein [Dolichospermum sp. ST_sed9]
KSFLDLSADNLILMAFKPSEDDLEKFIIRFYECHGKTADLSLKSEVLSLGEPVDLLENNITTAENIQPWKIATFQAVVNIV